MSPFAQYSQEISVGICCTCTTTTIINTHYKVVYRDDSMARQLEVQCWCEFMLSCANHTWNNDLMVTADLLNVTTWKGQLLSLCWHHIFVFFSCSFCPVSMACPGTHNIPLHILWPTLTTLAISVLLYIFSDLWPALSFTNHLRGDEFIVWLWDKPRNHTNVLSILFY